MPVDMAGSGTWQVTLAAAAEAAEADFRDIIRWTAEESGDAQGRAYAETLSAAIESLRILHEAMDLVRHLPASRT